MPRTNAERAAQSRYQSENVTRTTVKWYPADAELREWVSDHGGSAYLKALARADMESKSVAGLDQSMTSDGWHTLDDDEHLDYYVEDGMVTRATRGEGMKMLPAYLYVKTRSGALNGVEFPRDAAEVVRMLVSGKWTIR